MSATTVSIDLRVRGSELGPGSVVHPSHFSRYLEQARWQIFDAPNFALAGKIESGVVRAQTIELDEELRYGDRIVVSIWLARVGRTSFDFGQRIERQNGQRVASARCTIVQIGPTGPIPIDPDLAGAVVEAECPTQERLDGALEGDVFELPFVVRPTDTDAFSHVNQARYIDFAEDARILAARANHPAGAEGRLRRVSLEYERETLAGDAVTTRVARRGELERSIELVRGGAVLTRIRTRYA